MINSVETSDTPINNTAIYASGIPTVHIIPPSKIIKNYESPPALKLDMIITLNILNAIRIANKRTITNAPCSTIGSVKPNKLTNGPENKITPPPATKAKITANNTK